MCPSGATEEVPEPEPMGQGHTEHGESPRPLQAAPGNSIHGRFWNWAARTPSLRPRSHPAASCILPSHLGPSLVLPLLYIPHPMALPCSTGEADSVQQGRTHRGLLLYSLPALPGLPGEPCGEAWLGHPGPLEGGLGVPRDFGKRMTRIFGTEICPPGIERGQQTMALQVPLTSPVGSGYLVRGSQQCRAHLRTSGSSGSGVCRECGGPSAHPFTVTTRFSTSWPGVKAWSETAQPSVPRSEAPVLPNPSPASLTWGPFSRALIPTCIHTPQLLCVHTLVHTHMPNTHTCSHMFMHTHTQIHRCLYYTLAHIIHVHEQTQSHARACMSTHVHAHGPLCSTQALCLPRFADHLHKFHENDNGAAAGDLWQ